MQMREKETNGSKPYSDYSWKAIMFEHRKISLLRRYFSDVIR